MVSVPSLSKRRGIDVVTAVDLNMRGAEDPDHLARALGDGRILFAHDNDVTRSRPGDASMLALSMRRVPNQLEASCVP